MKSPSEALPRPTGLPRGPVLQPPEATAVNPQLSFLEDGGHVYWFLYLQVCDCYLQGDRLARALLGAVPDVEPGDSGGIGAGARDQRAHGDARAAADAAGGGVELRAAAAAAAAARDRGPGGAGAGGGAAARGASLRGVARELELCFETLRQYKREACCRGSRRSGRAGGQRLPQRQRAAPRRPGTWRQTFPRLLARVWIRRGARRERRGDSRRADCGQPARPAWTRPAATGATRPLRWAGRRGTLAGASRPASACWPSGCQASKPPRPSPTVAC